MALGVGELLLVLLLAGGGMTAGNNPVVMLGASVLGRSLPASVGIGATFARKPPIAAP